MEFIEYLKFSTGQEKSDIDDWKLKNSYDLIQEFIEFDRSEQLKLHGVGVTLPSKDEVVCEIVDRIGRVKTDLKLTSVNEEKVKGYTVGFKECYNWIKDQGN